MTASGDPSYWLWRVYLLHAGAFRDRAAASLSDRMRDDLLAYEMGDAWLRISGMGQ